MNETLKNLIDNLLPWWDLGYVFGLIMGLAFIVKGLFAFGVSGKRSQQGSAPYVVTLIAGILLLNITGVLDATSQTFFLENSATGLADVDNHITVKDDRFGLYMKLSYMLVVLVGLYGVVQGGILFDAAGKNGEKFGPAMAHLIGGALAVNIDKLLLVFSVMVGGGFQQTISGLFN